MSADPHTFAEPLQTDVLPAPTGERLSRRTVLAGMLGTIGTAAAGQLGAVSRVVAQPAQTSPYQPGRELIPIGEIGRRNDGLLRAVIRVRDDDIVMPQAPTRPSATRFMEGRDPDSPGTLWPPTAEPTGFRPLRPGPTLRARVGDKVQITLLNQVNTELFPESGVGVKACDESDLPGNDQDYPGWLGDTSPNCFHASSITNMHFHGTHVTPDGLGDNVLLQVIPDRRVDEQLVADEFDAIFAATAPPSRWDAPVNADWRKLHSELLERFDVENGTDLNAANQALVHAGYWPQFHVGAYPFSFTLTPQQGHKMGQSPGTHWYHAHKHGSTALNLLHGMAGAFIIEGGYCDSLKKLYGDAFPQRVIVVQQYQNQLNAMFGGNRFEPPPLMVNGQPEPVITLRRGEMQLWRFVNATVQGVMTILPFAGDGAPAWRQTAQDGVQFHWDNLVAQPLLGAGVTTARRNYTFAPGNRFDLLVCAPADAVPGTTFPLRVQTQSLGGMEDRVLLNAVISGEPAMAEPQLFPASEMQVPFPTFLDNLDEKQIRVFRRLEFAGESGQQLTINGQPFSDSRFDQTMILDDTEEWTLINRSTGVAHPFHIHVNPFQVVRIVDPQSGTTYQAKPGERPVWQDVVAIPPMSGSTPGEVTIRHKFVDFAGSFVLHCHILAHEDRGMMQLVRVISNQTVLRHH